MKCKKDSRRRPSNCLLAEWKRNPSLLDKDKLSLVGLNIRIIDAIPAALASSVRVLYLSDNSICNLTGLEQFSNTVTLSIKNNSIRYLDEIRSLSLLRRLTKLSMEGNPVTRLPYYREHVIVSCQSLTVLDDKAISADERATATKDFYRNTAYYDQLRINELRNCVISHIRNLTACHLEFQQYVFGKFSHFLSEHIGQHSAVHSRSQGAASSSGVCVTAGLGKVLQQALDGGVFCWLQRMDIKHFNHLVQDTLLQLLAHYLQQGNGVRQSAAAGSKADLWSTLLESYLKEQCSVFMEASEQCAELRRMCRRPGHGRDRDQEWSQLLDAQEEAQEYDAVMCCVDRVQFLTSPCTFACSCRAAGRSEQATTVANSTEGSHTALLGAAFDRHRNRTDDARGTSTILKGHPGVNAPVLLQSPDTVAGPAVQHHNRGVERQLSEAPQSVRPRPVRRPASPPPPPPPPLSPPIAANAELSIQTSHSHSKSTSNLRHSSYKELSFAPTQRQAVPDLSGGVLRQSAVDHESRWAAQQQQMQRERERNSDRYDQLLRTTLHNSSAPAAAPSTLLPNKGSRPSTQVPAVPAPSNIQHPATAVRSALSSKLLPPQQMDPEPESAPQEDATPDASEGGEDSDAAWTANAQASAQFQSEVADFLRRALQSELALADKPAQDQGGQDEMETGKEADDPLLDLAFSHEMESRWLLAAQTISAYLTSSDQARDVADSRELRAEGNNAFPAVTPAEGTTIAALKAQITAQNNKFVLSQRAEFVLYGLNRTLWEAAEAFGEQLLSLAKAAERQFAVQRKEIDGVRADALFGSTCLQGHRTALNHAEGVHERIQELNAAKASLLAAERSCLQSLTAAREQHHEFVTKIGRVESTVADLQSNSSAIALVRHARVSSRARAFWLASRACAALKASMFRLLRKRVRRQRKIRHFCAVQRRRGDHRAGVTAFAAWKAFVAVQKRGRQLQRWTARATKLATFRQWRAAFTRCARRLPAAIAAFRTRAIKRAFAAFVEARRSRIMAAGESERHGLYVALFTSVRVFRAWKRLAQTSRSEEQQLLSAVRHRAQLRVLHAWDEGARQRKHIHNECASIVESWTARRRYRACLYAWRSLLHYRNQLCTLRRMKRSFRNLRTRLLSQRRQKAAQLMASVVAASGEGLLRGALIRSVRLWRSRTVRRRRRASASAKVASCAKAGVLRNVWGTWRALSQRFRSLSRHMVLVARRTQWYALRHCFSGWLTVLPRLSNSSLVSSQKSLHLIRQKWLNLFGDTAGTSGVHLLPREGELVDRTETQLGNSYSTRIAERGSVRPQHQQQRGNRLRGSMSTVDFQLLYLDDDEEEAGDEEEEEVRGGGDVELRAEGQLEAGGRARSRSGAAHSTVRPYSVLTRRYWARWVRRSCARASLRNRHDAVRNVALAASCRRALAAMRSILTTSLLNQKDRLRAHLEAPAELQLSHPDMQTRRAEIGDSDAADQRKCSDLRQLSDGLNLALTESRSACEAQQSVLTDLDSSIGALLVEKASLCSRIQAAKTYIANIQQQRDQYLSKTDADRSQASEDTPSFIPPTLPGLLARLSAPPAASAGSNQSGSGSGGSVGDGQQQDDCSLSITVQSESSCADERVLLMQDVEALYREAVAAQEQMLRRKQHLGNRREAAATLLQQRKHQEQQLDAQTAALLEERAGAEEALRRCTDALQDAFQKVNEQTRYHEEVLAGLQGEEGELRARLRELSLLEQRLTSRVEALQDHYQQQDLHSASASSHVQQQKFAPLGMAEREARAVQHLSISMSRSRSNAGRDSRDGVVSHAVIAASPSLGAPSGAAGAAAGRDMQSRRAQGLGAVGRSGAKAEQRISEPHKIRPPAGRRRKLEGKENELSAEQSQRVDTAKLTADSDASRSGDAIGREIDALSLKIRQRLSAI